MKSNKWILSLCTSIILFAVLFTPDVKAAVNLADGTYTINYTVLKADNDSASMANDYFAKPATLVVKNGDVHVQIVLKNSAWIKSFEINNTTPSVISSDKNADTRTVQFKANSFSSPLMSKIHVDIEAMNYNHVYTIRFRFDENSITPVNIADDTKQAESKPATNTTSEAEKTNEKTLASEEKPSAVAIDNPKTGDTTSMVSYLLLFVASSMFIIYRFSFRNKHEKENVG